MSDSHPAQGSSRSPSTAARKSAASAESARSAPSARRAQSARSAPSAPVSGWSAAAHEEDPHFKSSTHWIVLALVIERPSYGYEINARFDRRFSTFMSVNASKIYDSLNRLGDLGLIEVVASPDELRPRGQESMRRYFRATAHGARAYKRWAAGQPKEDHRRADLLSRVATVGVLGLHAILDVIDRYERDCLRRAQAMQLPSIAAEDEGKPASIAEHVEGGLAGIGGVTGLADLLVAEQQRFAVDAELAWAAFARRQILACEPRLRGER